MVRFIKLQARICISVAVLATFKADALENLDYVAEHLFEVAMDNRLATLPLWSSAEFSKPEWRFTAQLGYDWIESGSVSIAGERIAFAVERAFGSSWAVRGIVFSDSMGFSGTAGEALLSPSYLSTSIPLAVPATARFGNLSGEMTHRGISISASRSVDRGWLQSSAWTIGLAFEQLRNNDYRAAFTVLDGATAGATGTVDYSAEYSFVTPFVGMQWRLQHGDWIITPHWEYFLPIPRRGFVGAISGPGFSSSGNSGTAGYGKYVSDQLLTAGCAITHGRSGLTFDLGTTLVQYLLEPFTHNGVDKNFVLSIGVEF